ncbi:hypothetical protein [Flammeovirga aprica]|uniref:Uncharacterized protein n=1 Tax=Flammeovirga aprica JL-4 TaxID=694437 RepID=A0A7X9XB79_9BACT|nr:hypothetical protein [Flammeovirga aprica]NME70451.1 hypothetical protein [Flammeovirga aprica JL-4]
MHDFIPFPDTSYIPDKYYVVIPDSLYNTGKLNSMNKLYTYFVQKGINIYHVGTDKRNQAFIFRSKPTYQNKIMNIKSVKVLHTNKASDNS